MLKYSITIGLNDKDTLKQELDTDVAIEKIASIVGDCTIKQGGIGYYTMSSGDKVVEKSLLCEHYSEDEKDIKVKAMCEKIKAELNQESVILLKEVVSSMFI